MIGKKISNYEIKSLLGEGGMGNVFLAEHVSLGRKVAIKSLHQQLVKNEGIRNRFKNEASTMAHFQHPKIVALYDYIEEDDGLYLIMEYVDGMSLDEYIKMKSGPIPEAKAIPMMEQILEAFAYAHNLEIVHRDIKPSNIIITKNDEIKILDFGIAKVLSEGGNKLTKTGTQMGTVFYMSPEQVQGKDVDIRSDIYSLGVTFFQMLTGSSPYDRLNTEYEIYSKIVSEPLPFASQVYPGVPTHLDQVILKATEKSKEDRFQNCGEFARSLTKKNFKANPNSTSPHTVLSPTHEAPNRIGEQSPSTLNLQPTEQKSLKLAFISLAVCFSIGILLYIYTLNNYYKPYNYDESYNDIDTTSDIDSTVYSADTTYSEPYDESSAPAYEDDYQEYETYPSQDSTEISDEDYYDQYRH
jgi:serine/threonine protein kinase